MLIPDNMLALPNKRHNKALNYVTRRQ